MEYQKMTDLENSVLEWLLSGDDPVLIALRHQLASAKVKSREFTGVGFYLHFDVTKNNKPLHHNLDVKPNFCFGDVDVFIGESKDNVSFLLWIKNGYIDFLEAYTYGNDRWPTEIDSFQLRYLGDKRDMDSLRKIWKS